MLTLSETMQTALNAGNPQRVLLEFTDPDSAEIQTFSNEEIAVDRGVRLSTAFNAEEDLTVGLCPSAQIQFTLLNDERQLADFRFGECAAWIGVRIDEGTPSETAKKKFFTESGAQALYEFAPLGIFKVERPDVVAKDTIDITAYDRMALFEDEEMPSRADLAQGTSLPTSGNITLKQLLQAMCTKVGVTLATQTFLNSGLEFTSWPSKYFESKTMKEVLRWIAEAAGSIARFNRQGQLEMTWFQEVNVTYDEHDYKDFVPTWYETMQIDGLKVRNQGETRESTIGTNPKNPYVIAGNPFLS